MRTKTRPSGPARGAQRRSVRRPGPALAALGAALFWSDPAVAQEGAPEPTGPEPEGEERARTGVGGSRRAVEPAPPPEASYRLSPFRTPDGEYRTPLAGEGFTTEVFGASVQVRERDRSDIDAVTLGGSLYTPEVGEYTVLPFGALFMQRYWPEEARNETERYARFIFAGVVNELDYYTRRGPLSLDGFGPVVHLETDYRRMLVPEETIAGDSVEANALRWGWAGGWLGLGYRTRVWPGEVDNDLRLEVAYAGSYYSFVREHDAFDSFPTPPETYVQGLRVRTRLDMLRKNLFEMPHEGVFAGGDLELMARGRWESLGDRFGLEPDPALLERTSETRQYLKLSAFLVGATKLPGLSSRHRLVAWAFGGWSPPGDLDRFSAFRIGGGPLMLQTVDLGRVTYPGPIFDQLIAQRYVSTTLEYRFEPVFFLFLSAAGSFFSGKIADSDAPRRAYEFDVESGWAVTGAVTTGLPAESQLRLSYTWESRLARGGDGGSTIFLRWSISF